jgi:hypothetical protein
MNEARRPRRSKKVDLPFHVAYFWVMAFQLPVWLFGGLVWSLFMIALAGTNTVSAFLGGLAWGFFMWISVGSFLAIGLAWRREAELPILDRDEFRSALERACKKLRFKVLNETPDEVVLGPKRVLFRFQFQESRLEFADRMVVLKSPALFFGRIRKALKRELHQATQGRENGVLKE